MGFDEAATMQSLCEATKECKRGVVWKDSVANYYNHSLTRNERLLHELETGKYKLSSYVKFTIREPKVRNILATRIRDRVWQRSMCNNGVYEDLTRGFIYDNGACRKGYGTDHAIRRVKTFLHRMYNEQHNNEGYAIHMDICKYFPSTPHSVAKEVIRSRISDQRFLPYLFEIIDSFEDPRPAEEIAADPFGERGIGLGSQLSQLIQLAVPDDIDHWIKSRHKYYVRYMDDFLIIDRDREKLRTTAKGIESRLNMIGLTVKSSGIFRMSSGITFLKLRFYLTKTGKVIVKNSRKAEARERKKLRSLKKLLDGGRINMHTVEQHFASWRGTMMRANAGNTIERISEYYTVLFRHKPLPIKGGKRSEILEHKRTPAERTAGKREAEGTALQSKS